VTMVARAIHALGKQIVIKYTKHFLIYGITGAFMYYIKTK